MPNVRMYSSQFCPYCVRAERLLNHKGVTNIEKIMIDQIPDAMEKMVALTGRYTVPQIFIGEQHVGGFDDLAALERQGGLDSLLENP